jgi:hypothetical protein
MEDAPPSERQSTIAIGRNFSASRALAENSPFLYLIAKPSLPAVQRFDPNGMAQVIVALPIEPRRQLAGLVY